jgi:hypothetical protein
MQVTLDRFAEGAPSSSEPFALSMLANIESISEGIEKKLYHVSEHELLR